MVCESPRKRSLLINRRGTFFEDPFFRDSWADYNSAVRRIVDRFNHGWVAPSERIRDSQYQSMYQTLRTAKLTYSTHSARFKEDGDVYKLVMDVHEFLGGDITVRTAGSTVSVRGKLEAESSGAAKLHTEKGADDGDDSSIISGRSSTTKTLHRRFTLPVEADCDEIESSISKDAVLTVVIPKRKDIHYIPVKIEGRANGRSATDDKKRNGSVKRPNDSPLLSSRKKQQDETPERNPATVGWRSRFKDLMENKENDGGNCDNFSKRRSRFQPDEEDKSSKRKSTSTDESPPREPVTLAPKERRRLSAKYEDAHEIHIPVQLERDDIPDKILRPEQPRVYNIEIARDAQSPTPESVPLVCPKVDGISSWNRSTKEPTPETTPTLPQDGYKSSHQKPIWCRSRTASPVIQASDKFKFDQTTPAPLKIKEVNPCVFFQNNKRDRSCENNDTLRKSPEVQSKTSSRTKTAKIDKIIPTVQLERDDSVTAMPINETDNLNVDISGHDTLETPAPSTALSKSPPLSPGGRDIVVEKRESLMEDDIFKDCWGDFSNTLQDVLNRLQELSSELGQSKILADSTPDENTDKPEEPVSLPSSGVDAMRRPSQRLTSTTQEDDDPTEADDQITIESRCASSDESSVGASPVCDSQLSDADDKNQIPDNEEEEEEEPSKSVAFTLDLTKPKTNGAHISDYLEESHIRPSCLLPEHTPDDSVLASLRQNSPVNFLRSRDTTPSLSPESVGCVAIGASDFTDDDLAREVPSRSAEDKDALSLSSGQSRANSWRDSTSPDHVKLSLLESPSDESLYDNTDIASGVYSTDIDDDHDTAPGNVHNDSFKVSDWPADIGEESYENNKTVDDPYETTDSDRRSSETEPMLNDDSYDAWKSRILTERPASPFSEYSSGLYGVTSRPPPTATHHSLDASSDRDVIENEDIECADILNDDVMGRKHGTESMAARPHVRTPLVNCGNSGYQRVSAPHKQRLATHTRQKQGHVEEPIYSRRDMGNVLSRGKGAQAHKADARPSSPRVKSPAVRCENERVKCAKSRDTVEEKTLPPYVRQRSEPSKRFTGFSHIQSNNVRRMRDVWHQQDGNEQMDAPSKDSSPSPASTPSRRTPNSTTHSSPSRTPTRTFPVSARDKLSSRSCRRHSPSPTRHTDAPSTQRTRPASYNPDPKPPPLTSRGTHTSRSNRPSSPLTSAKKYPHADRAANHVGAARSPYSVRKPFESKETVGSESSRRTVPNKVPNSYSTARPKPDPAKAPKVHQKIFKRFRNANLLPDSEALCFKEEKDCYKMVLDVQEFVPGEVDLQQDDRLLTVKGKVETKDGRNVSIRTFNRTFDIPQNSKEEEIDSALSEDGILTIYVPKKKERIIKIELVD